MDATGMMTTGRICVSETNNIGKPPLTKYYRRDAGMQNYCLALLVAAIWTAEAEQAMTGVMNMVSTIIRSGLCLPVFTENKRLSHPPVSGDNIPIVGHRETVWAAYMESV